MIGHITIHGTNHTQIIRMRTELGKKLTDGKTTLAVGLECKGRCKGCSGDTLSDQVGGEQGAMPSLKLRLGVKGIHMRRTPFMKM